MALFFESNTSYKSKSESSLMSPSDLGGYKTSSFLVTTDIAVGSRLDADRTSFSCASFFSNVSAMAVSFFSKSKFFNPVLCCTSSMAFTNLP